MSIIGISGKINSGKDTVGKIIQCLSCKDDNYFTNNTEEAIKKWDGNFDNLSKWKTRKFADKIKDIICILIDCNREQLEDREFKDKELGEEWWYYSYGNGAVLIPYLEAANKDDKEIEQYLIKLTPRKLFQLLGTECGREIIHPNIWINTLFTDYKEYGGWYKKNISKTDQKCNWIITDLRFPNEAKAIKDRGGIVIRVNRDIKKTNVKLGEKYIGNVKMEYNSVLDNPTKNHLSETALDNYKDWDYVIENNKDLNHLINEVKQILIKENML